MHNLGGRAKVGMIVERGVDLRFVPDQQELNALMLTACKRSALDHHAHADIATHRVYGDTRQVHPPNLFLSAIRRRRRRSRDRCSDRKPCTGCAGASVHHSSNIHGTPRASERRGCGACPGGRETFFSWGQPFRHLFLQCNVRIKSGWPCRPAERRRAYSAFLVRCKLRQVSTARLDGGE